VDKPIRCKYNKMDSKPFVVITQNSNATTEITKTTSTTCSNNKNNSKDDKE
jgi:hypothetical protein